MAKAEKILRVNIPFRVLPETLSLLSAIAGKEKRSNANMLEVLVDQAAEKQLTKKEIEAIKKGQ